MTELTEKEVLLENSGYRYHFDRMIYFNRAARRAFSIEFVEDHSFQEIQQLVNELPSEGRAVPRLNELEYVRPRSTPTCGRGIAGAFPTLPCCKTALNFLSFTVDQTGWSSSRSP